MHYPMSTSGFMCLPNILLRLKLVAKLDDGKVISGVMCIAKPNRPPLSTHTHTFFLYGLSKRSF